MGTLHLLAPPEMNQRKSLPQGTYHLGLQIPQVWESGCQLTDEYRAYQKCRLVRRLPRVGGGDL